MGHSLEGSNNHLLPSEWEKNNFVNSINMKNSDVGLSDVLFLDVENSGMNSCTIVKGRLRECIAFWESIGTSRWVLEIIREGYCLPFVALPGSMTFLNHQSAIREAEFVAQEIDKLLQSGALVEVEVQDLIVCNPLGVVFNNSQKPRLILDLRYVNKHLRSCKFQYEDIRTAANLFKRGDWFIKFDYVSGYHHVEIYPEHTNFLGCSWIVNGTLKFFKFTVLPFGLSTGPYVFSKIQRALVKHWRGKGLRIFTFLDDGAGAECSLDLARDMSTIVQRDIAQSGFVAHTEKCQWEPTQSGELLGFIMDLRSGNFYVPPRRVEALRTIVHRVRSQKFYASARCLARLTGMLVSMGLALGPVVRLWTRALYREIMQAASWDRLFLLSEEAQNEVKFWMENFSNSGYPIWAPCPKIDVMTYSDASEIGWGGYAVQIGDLSATGCWSEADRKRSSTWREIRGTKLVLQSLVDSLKGKEVLHRTDNQNTVRILSVGSRKQDLHQDAIDIYKLCQVNNIRLAVEWVSRDDNVRADTLSRTEDANDYKLDPIAFNKLDKMWGPHTVDRFASYQTKLLPRFCSRFRNPGCESIDAFTVSWGNENNWIFPPPYLIPRVIQHMADGKEYGTIILPEWHSAPWWPLLVTRKGTWQDFVKDSYKLEPYDGILIPGSAASTQFALGVPAYSILAVRVSFSSDV